MAFENLERYKILMENHFDGCPILGEIAGTHHGRCLKAYYIGEDEKVGLSDQTDAWISPVAYPASLHLERAIARLKEGLPPQTTPAPRRRIVLDPEIVAPVTRRRIHV